MVICNKRYTLDFAAGADMFDQVGSLCRLKNDWICGWNDRCIAVSEMCGFFGTGILSQTYANQYQT